MSLLQPGGYRLTTAQHALLAWLLVTMWLVPLAGCQGCWSSAPPAKKLTAEEELEEREKKKKKLAEKPKPDFELAPTIILPNEVGQDIEDDGSEKKPTAPKVVFYTKPGHWIAGLQAAKANNFDFQGEMRTFPMDQSELPLDVEHTDFRLSVTRPVSLGKGVPKRLETMFYLPKRGSTLSKSYSLRTELRATRSSRLPEIVNVAGNSLREHEYYLVVLAKNPSSYIDIAKLDSIQLYNTELGGFQTGPFDQVPPTRFYHAVFPRTDKSVPLPSHPLAWTMIAYIVWDDIDPIVLTAEQQTALLDWLHWGGQLIISGPNSLDRLKQTFLEPYLPAASGKAMTIDAARMQELNENWSVKASKELKKPAIIVIPEGKPLVGVELEKHPDADWLPDTGELVTERRVGNGRIVVSAFSLSAPPYRFWASRDNFFNACLLRRPARQFELIGGTDLHMRWAGKMSWANPGDPRIASRLRFFSRDIGSMREPNTTAPTAPVPMNPNLNIHSETSEAAPEIVLQPGGGEQLQPVRTAPVGIEDQRFAGYQQDQLSGVAGWNDFSGAAEASLAALNDASGIKIPRSEFVLKVLLVYLAVLVPLNWLIFWLIGRVEYAWLAAPVIAIVGALAVVRLAQLDIGFARSRTEIAIMESHAGYPRAHVTRYAALYTSLSTSYDIRFDDPDALALPFALSETHARRITRPASDVLLTQDKTIELSDVQVQSNSTGKIHMEQMLELDSPFVITGDEARGWQLENGSQFTLRQAGVLRRVKHIDEDDEGKLVTSRIEAAYFPDIEPGATVRLNFQPVTKETHPWVPQWNNSSMMSATAPTDDENRVRLVRLAKLAAQQLELYVGDMRLIAWTDEPIPGLRIIPASAQFTTYTLVLVHLKSAPLPDPESDPRLRTDVLQDDIPSDDTEATSG